MSDTAVSISLLRSFSYFSVLRFHGGNHLRAVDGFAVMADAAGAPRQIGCQL
ncbi:MAG: hypothetical protein IPK19_40215 [Chloroflexi bacterium]|nr:hypothetical protein [Chloroflexota bacterium]